MQGEEGWSFMMRVGGEEAGSGGEGKGSSGKGKQVMMKTLSSGKGGMVRKEVVKCRGTSGVQCRETSNANQG